MVEAIHVSPVLMAAPADDVRLQLLAKFGANVKERGAIGTQQPFIAMHREHGGLDLFHVERERAQGLGRVDVKEDFALFEERADLIEGRAKTGGVTDLAHQHRARLRGDGIEEIGPLDLHKIHALFLQQRGVVELIGELIGERDDAVAGLPMGAAEEEREGRGGVDGKGDVFGGGVNELGGLGAGAVDIVEPVEKIGACQVVAVLKMGGDGGGGVLGE